MTVIVNVLFAAGLVAGAVYVHRRWMRMPVYSDRHCPECRRITAHRDDECVICAQENTAV